MDHAESGQHSDSSELTFADEPQPEPALPATAGLFKVATPPPPPLQLSFAEDLLDLLSQEQEIMAALPATSGKPTRRHDFFSTALSVLAGDVSVGNQPQIAESEYEEFERAVKRAPPYLVSTILHMTVLIALGLWMMYEPRDDNVTLLVTYSDVEPDQLENEPFELGTDEEALNPEIDPPSDILAIERQEIFTPTETVPQMDLLRAPFQENPAPLPDSSNNDLAPPQIGRLLKGRKPELRELLVRKYGGNKHTELAVSNSLDWLVRNQQEDGSWSLRGPYSNGGQSECDLAATGLALLALQGDGHTPETKTNAIYSNAVAKGWKWLLRHQNGRSMGQPSWQTYAHAICTIAICELYTMTGDQKYRQPAQEAVNYCLEAQGPNGGWRYRKGENGDMSVTGWYVMALQSARMGNLVVPDEALARVDSFLNSVESDGGRRYGYLDASSQPPALTAEGLLCRQYMGWNHDDVRLVDGVEFLGKNPIRWQQRNVYYWYYATQVLHHMEGERWNRWNEVMRDVLPGMQIKSGPESGSWDPQGDQWGNQGGRLYVTCLHTFMLEVYYRHLPIYNYDLRR